MGLVELLHELVKKYKIPEHSPSSSAEVSVIQLELILQWKEFVIRSEGENSTEFMTSQ